MRLFALLLIVFFLMTSVRCESEVRLDNPKVIAAPCKEVKVKDLYSICVLEYLKKTEGLLDEASLQYSDLVKEQYLIIVDEDKLEAQEALISFEQFDKESSMLENYAHFDEWFLHQSGEVVGESNWEYVDINGAQAMRKRLHAEVDGIPFPLTYWLTYIEGKNQFYSITFWTLKERQKYFENEVEQMIQSFKEI